MSTVTSVSTCADQTMNKKVQELVNQIRKLEEELRITLLEQEAKISYRI